MFAIIPATMPVTATLSVLIAPPEYREDKKYVHVFHCLNSHQQNKDRQIDVPYQTIYIFFIEIK